MITSPNRKTAERKMNSERQTDRQRWRDRQTADRDSETVMNREAGQRTKNRKERRGRQKRGKIRAGIWRKRNRSGGGGGAER